MTTIVPAFAGIVSAHHSNIAASVECSGVVSWTATSWSTGLEGTNPDIRVTLTVNGTTTEIAQGHFDSANNYQFSGTFQWPAVTPPANTITVSSTPAAPWANGVVSNVGGSVNVSKPANCPGQPTVTQAVSCSTPSPGHGDGTVVLTLTNPAGALATTVTFNVYPLDTPNGAPTAYPVAPGQTQQVTFSAIPDGPHTVKIIVGGVDKSQTFTVDCKSPIPATKADVVCANGDGDVTVTLTNTGGEAVVFDLTSPKDNASIEHITVGPDSSMTRTFTGFADGNYTVKIMVGRTDLSKQFTVACDQASTGSISVTPGCADHDGQVTIVLTAAGGNLPVIFVVNGTTYSVAPGTPKTVVIGGLNDGSTTISVTANGKDLSFVASSTCDLQPTYSVAQSCANFDDMVTVTINNPGDDVAVTFTINGVDHSVAPGASQTVVIGPLPDGQNSITLAINGVAQTSIVVTSHCDATPVVVPVCNTVTTGQATTYWYTVTNSAATSISVTWNNGGSATIAAGQSITVGSTSAVLTVLQGTAVIGQAAASATECLRDVTVTKVVQGQPPTGETYTITVSRLVGGTYVPVATFDLAAGASTILHLPSTLDPAGIDYKVEETNKGTATVSTVSPSGNINLTGIVGEAVAVTVTNGYASVRIDKTTSTAAVLPGGQITYTLQAVNTGGLTLNPVVVTDRLPASVEFVSADVANNGGTCSLVQAARPQLVSCTMNGSLAPGASTNVITLVVKVDADISPGLTIVNQARVNGAYQGTSDLAQNAVSTGASGALSCNPLIPDSVCSLSAAVNVPVTLTQSSPPTPTPASSSQVVAQLPRTGASNLGDMLTFGFGAILLGGALLLSKRRIGAR